MDPFDLEEVRRVVAAELEAEEPSLVISRRPCALLKNVKHLPPLTVDPEACTGCRACRQAGCPALSVHESGGGKRQAVIDPNQCVGCDICAKICRFGAIGKGGGLLMAPVQNNVKNILIVGVGGQGTLLASKLMGRVCMEQGYDVKVSEVHGMSQRGGSVVTYVRYGDKVWSSLIEKGEADLIVSFEQLESARWLAWLKPGGVLVTNTQCMDPMPVIMGAAAYPEGILDTIRGWGSRWTPWTLWPWPSGRAPPKPPMWCCWALRPAAWALIRRRGSRPFAPPYRPKNRGGERKGFYIGL